MVNAVMEMCVLLPEVTGFRRSGFWMDLSLCERVRLVVDFDFV